MINKEKLVLKMAESICDEKYNMYDDDFGKNYIFCKNENKYDYNNGVVHINDECDNNKDCLKKVLLAKDKYE